MSSQIGTNRAGRTKDKNAKSTTVSASALNEQKLSQNKSEKSTSKNQATVEQLRMAQIIDSGNDTDMDIVKQLMDVTNRSMEDVVVALHDAQNDATRAVTILLEGGGGEWETQDKKKKRSNTLKASDKEPISNQTENDRGDARPDRSHEQFNDPDRQENTPPRRGRNHRNGGPPPRLANRGRGRDRNTYRNDRDRDRSGFNSDQDRSSGFNDRGGFRTANGEEDWDNEVSALDQGQTDRNRGGYSSDDRNRGGYSERREGSYGGDRRSFGGERGRGRGRGGGYGRQGSRGSGRPRRFDRQNESSDAPHIDTWTNETAENAEKETTAWGETWDSEDWSEDQWTGSLEETKVFTPSQNKAVSDMVGEAVHDLSTSISDSTSTLGQRLNPEDLFSASRELAKSANYNPKPSTGGPFFSDYNQQAAESIKNQIGIGSSARQNLSNMPSQPQSLSQLPAMPQREIAQSSHSSYPSSSSTIMPASAPAPLQSQPTSQQQQQQQQQRKPPRSKLPPPSKIPASAVEMPGQASMRPVDVQFGVDFKAESSGQFKFGSSADNTNSSYSSASPPSKTGHGNHMGSTGESPSDSNRQTNIMASPSSGAKSQNTLSSMDTSPSRPPVFSSVYTTPTKSNSGKVVEPIPYPSPVSDHKSSGLMNSQRTTQSPSALSQGSLSTSKPDTSTLPNFSVANGFPSSSYSHKSASSGSQSGFPHPPTVSSSASSYPGQFSSQTQYSGQQNQYPTGGQSQFPGSQGQFPAAGSAGGSSQGGSSNQYLPGQSQFPNSGSAGNQGSSFPPAPNVSQTQYGSSSSQFHSSYQSSSASFQPQPVSQAAQNSMYPSTTQQQANSNAYPSGSASFHVRDSPSAGSLSQSGSSLSQAGTAVSQSGNSYSSQQTPAAPGLSKASTTQSSSAFSTQTYSAQHSSASSGHNQPTPLTNKLGDGLSKMSLKDSSVMDNRSSQFDHGSSSATTAALTSTVSSSVSSATTSTVSATPTPVVTTSAISSRSSTSSLPISTTKAPPNLPPGVPVFNAAATATAAMYLNQAAASGIPPYLAGLQGLQQPIYGYEDLQMLQQGRMPLQAGNFYDMSAFPGVPSTLAAGRDQAGGMANSFSGAAADKQQMNRVEAQSPNQTSQQQNTHNAPQQAMPQYNFHYGFYYPGAVLPGTASFQYPMFQVPPVTNAAAPHVPGTTTGTATQLPKTYGSHQGFPSKELGWEQLIGTGAGNTELSSASFSKPHTQAFDKQGFPGGTPPPFNLSMANASQAGPLGAPAAPYGAPFMPMMPPQPHSQTLLHHPLQQDSSSGSGRGLQQAANQGKTGTAKPYASNWGGY